MQGKKIEKKGKNASSVAFRPHTFMSEVWLNCALLREGAKCSWGIVFQSLRSFWTRVHATASLRVAHHYL